MREELAQRAIGERKAYVGVAKASLCKNSGGVFDLLLLVPHSYCHTPSEARVISPASGHHRLPSYNTDCVSAAATCGDVS